MPSESQRRLLDTIKLGDDEIRHVTRNAAREADRIIRSLEGQTGIGAKVRSAQIALAKQQVQMWANVESAVKVGIGDAFDSATELQSLFDERMFASAGSTPYFWKQSLLAQSREGIESYTSRKGADGHTLSQRVYRNQALSRGYVERAINNGLLLGKSAAELAKDVVGYIDPSTPGGASAAAHRLARTEINNAFHETNIRNMAKTPWVELAQWNLSGSHPKPDECNEYAENVHIRRGQAGQFHIADVPAKPHPNCLCYIEPVVMDLDAYAKNFKAGKYDGYIQEQMGCSNVA